MITVTIQIGNTDDKLTQARWAEFVSRVHAAIARNLVPVHFFSCSPGGEAWQNACWVVTGDDSELTTLRNELQVIRAEFDQDSVAWTAGITCFI